MIRMRTTAYIYFLSLGIAGETFMYAMEGRITRSEFAKRVEEVITMDVNNRQINERAIAIAMAAGMPDRAQRIADSIRSAKQQREYAKQEDEFTNRHAASRLKSLLSTLSWYVRPIPYDCMVTVKKVGDYEDPGMTHTMYARNSYNIGDAQSIILIKIREHTKDFSKREDGRLNPDQQVSCDVRCTMPNGQLNRHYVFCKRAGDIWQEIENIMMHHFISLEKRESKE